MSPAIISLEPDKSHVPAWKRLGLKLKSAQHISEPYEEAIPVAAQTAEPEKDKKKRRAADAGSSYVKKAKNSTNGSEPSTNTATIQSPITTSPKRRKSVTFTPETKTEDGDSVKQLYNGWIAKNKGHDPFLQEYNPKSDLETPLVSQVSENIDSSLDEVLREVEGVKKPKKEKIKRKGRSNTRRVEKSASSLDPSLSYLKQFHTHRGTWKFNKIHQIHLLKYAFDVDKIPSEYVELLYGYITGLQGGARKQLRDSAIAVMVKDREDAEAESSDDADSAAKNKEFEEIFREKMVSFRALDTSSNSGYEESVLSGLSDLTMKNRMAKRMRAERILEELAQEVQESGEGLNGSSSSAKGNDADEEGQKRIKMNDGSIQKPRRKRKQRTAAVDESSSSESSSSESGSGDEPEEVSERNDEDTSSSSSSSSSASEGDEDSGTSRSETGSEESEP